MARKLLLPEDGAEASKLTTVSQSFGPVRGRPPGPRCQHLQCSSRRACIFRPVCSANRWPLIAGSGRTQELAQQLGQERSGSRNGQSDLQLPARCSHVRRQKPLAHLAGRAREIAGWRSRPQRGAARRRRAGALVAACDQRDPSSGAAHGHAGNYWRQAKPGRALESSRASATKIPCEPKLMMPPSAKGGGQQSQREKAREAVSGADHAGAGREVAARRQGSPR